MAPETPQHPVNQYPVNLVLERQPCLVVGAGRIASRKAEGLLACGARVHVIAAHIDSHIHGLEGVTWEERPYQRGDVAGYRLVITATDDPAVNRAVYEDGEAEGVWVNSADDPASCAFTLPSVIRQGAVMVHGLHGWAQPGPSRPGSGPGLAEQLGPEYGCWASCWPPSGSGSRPPGGRPRDSTGKRSLDSDMPRTHQERPGRPSEGAASGVSVVVVGLNQRTVALDMLERMTVSDALLPKALRDLKDRSHLSEVVVLSTCLLTEVYAVVERFHGGGERHTRLPRWGSVGVPPEDFAGRSVQHFEEGAAAHLFEVAAGIDSPVLGEGEVLGQVRNAWERAWEESGRRHDAVASVPPRRGGRKAVPPPRRPSPGGSRPFRRPPSPWSASGWAGRSTAMTCSWSGRATWARGMASALAASAGARRVMVANRTQDRAVELAERVGGEPVELGALGEALANVDVVLTSTGSPSILLEASDLAPVMRRRQGPTAAGDGRSPCPETSTQVSPSSRA